VGDKHPEIFHMCNLYAAPVADKTRKIWFYCMEMSAISNIPVVSFLFLSACDSRIIVYCAVSHLKVLKKEQAEDKQ